MSRINQRNTPQGQGLGQPAPTQPNPQTTGDAALLQAPFSWRDLPTDMKRNVIGHLSPARAAALAMTGRPENRLVEGQPHLPPLLLGAAQGPLPNYPHATLHRLVAPYGGLEATRTFLEQIHACGKVLSDDSLFAATLAAWAEQEVAAGAPEETIQEAVRVVNAVRQNLSIDLPWGLDLSDIPMRMLPPLARLRALVTLNLNFCTNLALLPEHLGDLKLLRCISLPGCVSLRSLPDCLGNLAALKALNLSGCDNLASLPDSLGNLVALEVLNLSGCTSLSSLPDSLGNQVALKKLNLNFCTSLRSLPDSLGSLVALQNLDLKQCTGLKSLPDSLGNLTALMELVLHGCSSLVSLPESLGSLVALKVLDLARCNSLASVPERLGDLAALEGLSLCNCTSLPSLPKRLGDLTALKLLDLSGFPNMTPTAEQAALEALPNLILQI